MSESAPTDRNGLVVLTFEQCLDLLGSVPVGRVAAIHDGQPLILPVNHVVIDRAVAFQSQGGAKLGAAIMQRPVAFEVDTFHAPDRIGWSVLVRGRAEPVDDADLLARLNSCPAPTWSPQAADGEWVIIRADEITGRRLPPDHTAPVDRQETDGTDPRHAARRHPEQPEGAFDLEAAGRVLLDQATHLDAGRAARTLTPGAGAPLKQTLLALRQGRRLDDHRAPGPATLQVLTGSVTLGTDQGPVALTAGQWAAIPLRTHDLQAHTDAVVLLTVALPH